MSNAPQTLTPGTSDLFAYPEPSTGITDTVHVAIVADAIAELNPDEGIEAATDQAERLLDSIGSLDGEAARVKNGEITWEHFSLIVKAALAVPAAPVWPLAAFYSDDELPPF